jgi:L-aspartate oxidase
MTVRGVQYHEALKRLENAPRTLRAAELPDDELLARYHPDYREGTKIRLEVGPSRGDLCQAELAALLQSNARIDEVDIAGVPVTDPDILVIGGGGGGIAAALTAAKRGAQVLLATKARLGDSNTVMAEGGIQAAVDPEDSPQRHYDDTFRGGHLRAVKDLVAQMAMEGPDAIRWLIQLGMQFDLDGSSLATKRAGGASVARILSFRDYTGLEMMRVLREAVWLAPGITVWERSPVVELLSNEHGHCAGAVICAIDRHGYQLVRAQSVIMATGGIGRLHLNGFPTSNHFGATGDGLALAYRLGARVRDLDSFQYHPTGVADPSHLAGSLITEAVRSAGAHLVNGLGERFVDELKPRDQVSAAIIRECGEGRGVVAASGKLGIWLDTPGLERNSPGILRGRVGGLMHLAEKCQIDPATTPFLAYPTLHYQNGGVVIDRDGASTVPGLYCVGELAGGIHGRNRLMGNALLDIIVFGRRAGLRAAEHLSAEPHRKITIEHLQGWQRELMLAELPLDRRSPPLFPSYANADRLDATMDLR